MNTPFQLSDCQIQSLSYYESIVSPRYITQVDSLYRDLNRSINMANIIDSVNHVFIYPRKYNNVRDFDEPIRIIDEARKNVESKRDKYIIARMPVEVYQSAEDMLTILDDMMSEIYNARRNNAKSTKKKAPTPYRKSDEAKEERQKKIEGYKATASRVYGTVRTPSRMTDNLIDGASKVINGEPYNGIFKIFGKKK